MKRSELPFFAAPEEEIRWLKNLLADRNIWCVLRVFPPKWRIERVTGSEFLNDLELIKENDIGGLQLFLGRADLAPAPVWRIAENGERDIDFTRSQAIQFDPAMMADGNVLLEGQIGIMRGIYYKEAGIDPKPIRNWFREVIRSFSQMSAGGTVVLRDPKTGTEKEYPDILASPGAVQWQRSGRALKQFVKGAYEFIVRDRAANQLSK